MLPATPLLRWTWFSIAIALLLAASPAMLLAQENVQEDATKAAQTDPESAEEEEGPPPLTEYQGRTIAQTMHYLGAEWLIRDSREREERCSLMLANLGVKKGMTVCDMGCGNGFYSLKLAELVGKDGKVLAVDIQPEMLALLKARAKKAGVENIERVLGKLHDPMLPKGEVDMILLVDVYHEFSHPEHMLRSMRESLAEGGLVVLVEYRSEDPDVPIKKLHKMSKAQIEKELTANGFKLAKSYDELPWQHMMFYEKDKDWQPEGTTEDAAEDSAEEEQPEK